MEKALKLAREGIARFPGEASLYQTLGTILSRMGPAKYSEARDAFQKSVSMQPTGAAYVAWALMEERAPDYAAKQQAAAVAVAAKTAAKASPASSSSSSPSSSSSTSSSVVSSEVAKERARVQRARELFEEGLKADPTHGPLYNAYANMEARHHRVGAAREVLRRGVANSCSDMAHVWHGLAVLELRQGNIDEARSMFRKGIDRFAGGGSFTRSSRKSEDATFLVHSLGTLEMQLQDVLFAFFERVLNHARSPTPEAAEAHGLPPLAVAVEETTAAVEETATAAAADAAASTAVRF